MGKSRVCWAKNNSCIPLQDRTRKEAPALGPWLSKRQERCLSDAMACILYDPKALIASSLTRVDRRALNTGEKLVHVIAKSEKGELQKKTT